jgi:hypothetical protein
MVRKGPVDAASSGIQIRVRTVYCDPVLQGKGNNLAYWGLCVYLAQGFENQGVVSKQHTRIAGHRLLYRVEVGIQGEHQKTNLPIHTACL